MGMPQLAWSEEWVMGVLVVVLQWVVLAQEKQPDLDKGRPTNGQGENFLARIFHKRGRISLNQLI
jgi:hypothetical protein